MPPRYAFWTILIDGKPTAFRAREKEELLPTFQQLKRTNKDVVFKWFARGRVWETPEQAQAALRAPRVEREKRTGAWRPGGKHEDPRERFKKKSGARSHKFDSSGPRPTGPRPPDRPWGEKPSGARPRGDRPWGTKPSSGRPRGDRPWSAKPSSDRPRSDRPWGGKKPGGTSFRPHHDRPPRQDRPPRPDRPPVRREHQPPPRPEATPEPPPPESIKIKPEPPERG